MKRYESSLFNNYVGNELTHKVLNSLGISADGEAVPWQGNASSIETSRLCSVISVYRLLDVIAMSGGGASAPTVERSPILVVKGTFCVSMDNILL